MFKSKRKGPNYDSTLNIVINVSFSLLFAFPWAKIIPFEINMLNRFEDAGIPKGRQIVTHARHTYYIIHYLDIIYSLYYAWTTPIHSPESDRDIKHCRLTIDNIQCMCTCTVIQKLLKWIRKRQHIRPYYIAKY